MSQKRITVINNRSHDSVKVLLDAFEAVGFSARSFLPKVEPSYLIGEEFWEELLDTDYILYRAGLGVAGSSALWDKLQGTDIQLLNETCVSNNAVFDKIYQTSVVSGFDYVRLPKTVIGKLPYEIVEDYTGPKCIIKASRGARGEKVFLANNKSEYESACDNIKRALVQEYIPNNGDFRIFIIGGEIQGVFKRVQAGEDFRSNISVGGQGVAVEDEKLRANLCEISLKLASHFKFDICGVDLMQSEEDGQLYFIEINSSPYWGGLDATLGTDTPKAIAEFTKRKFLES